MKRINNKRISAFVLAVSMVLSMSVPSVVSYADQEDASYSESAFDEEAGSDEDIFEEYIPEDEEVNEGSSEEEPVPEEESVTEDTSAPEEESDAAEAEQEPAEDVSEDTADESAVEGEASDEADSQTEIPESEAAEQPSDGSETGDLPDTEAPEQTEAPAETETAAVPETEELTETEEILETEAVPETEEILETDEVQETEEIEETEETQEETDIWEGMSEEDINAVVDHLRSDTKVPVEGLPSLLTQEMVSGALRVQDEYGYPASVTIAQIIYESGVFSENASGSSGEETSAEDISAEETSELTRLAYENHNLFAMKGEGPAGSVEVFPEELNNVCLLVSSSDAYKAYNTDTQSIDDRSEYLKAHFAKKLSRAEDADSFAMILGEVWSSDKGYGLNLKKIMKKYELKRLDDITLADFEALLGTFVNPCPDSHVTSGFGYREFDSKVHLGIDLATNSRKIPTYAAYGGTVVSVGYGPSTGNMVVIDHGNGIVTKYMHHSEMYVKEGEKVFKGQQIGLSGTTGHSTGIHLHFQIEINGEPVNPMPYLKDDSSGEVITVSGEEEDAGSIMTACSPDAYEQMIGMSLSSKAGINY